MLPDFGQPKPRVFTRKPVGIERDQADQLIALGRRHRSDRQAEIGDNNIVLEARGVAVEWQVHANQRLGALLWRQCIHKRPALRFFLTQDGRTLVDAGFRQDRLGAKKHR